MNHKIFGFLAIVCFGVLVISMRGFAPAETTAPIQSDDIAFEFKEKIVLLEVDRSSSIESKSGSVLMEKVRVCKLGTRDFVIGIGYASKDEDDLWYQGMVVGVPCDSVLRFQVMTQDQFKDFETKFEERSTVRP